MRKLFLLLVAILAVGCSNDNNSNEQQQQTNKNYNNLVYLDGVFERYNRQNDQLPVTQGDDVMIFDFTTDIEITQSYFKTNLTPEQVYSKQGNNYFIPNGIEFIIFENERIIIKNTTTPTDYGHFYRSERYSY